MFETIMRALRGSPEKRSFDLNDDLFFSNSKAGQVVNEESALSIMAVYASVRLISEGLASLPIASFTETAGGWNTEAVKQPEWLTTANLGLGMSTQDLISQTLVSLLLRGNAFVFVVRGQFNKVVALEVMDPDTVTVKRQGAFVVYEVGDVRYTTAEVLHVRGLTLPGALEGIDPITYAASTLGTGLAAQEYGSSYFENASLPSGFIGVPGNLSEVGADMLRRSWDRLHSGQENAGSVAVLTEGAEFRPLALSPEQTQFLDVKRFTVQDIARLFGVPPHLLADSSNSTSWGSGLAEQNSAYAKATLIPWASRLERAFTTLLRSEGGPRQNLKSSVVINLDGYERGAFSDRIDTYAAGIAAGIYDPNEVRGWEDLPPLDHHHGAADPTPSALVPGESTPADSSGAQTDDNDEPEEG